MSTKDASDSERADKKTICERSPASGFSRPLSLSLGRTPSDFVLTRSSLLLGASDLITLE
jgi:hypothetical protein